MAPGLIVKKIIFFSMEYIILQLKSQSGVQNVFLLSPVHDQILGPFIVFLILFDRASPDPPSLL